MSRLSARYSRTASDMVVSSNTLITCTACSCKARLCDPSRKLARMTATIPPHQEGGSGDQRLGPHAEMSMTRKISGEWRG
jgi:hypothetical protein